MDLEDSEDAGTSKAPMVCISSCGLSSVLLEALLAEVAVPWIGQSRAHCIFAVFNIY